MLQYEDSRSPLRNLEQAAVHYAAAIRLSPRDARLHFLLGVVLEEQHHATLMYSLQRRVGRPAAAKHAWLNFFITFSFKAVNTYIAGSCLQSPLSTWPVKSPAETRSGKTKHRSFFFKSSKQTLKYWREVMVHPFICFGVSKKIFIIFDCFL